MNSQGGAASGHFQSHLTRTIFQLCFSMQASVEVLALGPQLQTEHLDRKQIIYLDRKRGNAFRFMLLQALVYYGYDREREHRER